MMEGIRESSIEEKSIPTPENGLEIPKHLDVAEVMKEKNAFFVHMVSVFDKSNLVSENNTSIDTMKLSPRDKLDILYSMSPTVSASTLRPHTQDGTFMGQFGVIFSHGEIESAALGDIGSAATSLSTRNTGRIMNDPEEVNRAIDRNLPRADKSYNEIILKNPEVAGGFLKLPTDPKRVKYESEEQEYHGGQKVVTKIGFVDFSDPVDWRGRPTGEKFDRHLSTLKDMTERGKTFFMDEANQMYIIKNIDEATRKVEFIASPLTPKDFAFHYGEERMNKYHKKEMKDRLQASLEEKGMSLS